MSHDSDQEAAEEAQIEEDNAYWAYLENNEYHRQDDLERQAKRDRIPIPVGPELTVREKVERSRWGGGVFLLTIIPFVFLYAYLEQSFKMSPQAQNLYWWLVCMLEGYWFIWESMRKRRRSNFSRSLPRDE